MGQRHHKNIRMHDWDYSQPAMYMVTICIADRTHRLGMITPDDKVLVNDAGKMVSQELLRLEKQYSQVFIEDFVIMPNHTHFLIGLNLDMDNPSPLSLDAALGAFKSRTTNRYIKGVKMGLLPKFDKNLWQLGYYETVMRDERMTEERRQYIINNPANWRDDPEMAASRC